MEEYLLSRKADQTTIMHLTKAARKTWHWAKICYQENDHRHALVNLTFSLSYLAFARYYKKAPKVITFYKLLEEHSDSLLRKTYRLSKSPDPIKLGELERFLSQQEERI
jgi:nitroreductase